VGDEDGCRSSAAAAALTDTGRVSYFGDETRPRVLGSVFGGDIARFLSASAEDDEALLRVRHMQRW
jgi:hypothetical protein